MTYMVVIALHPPVILGFHSAADRNEFCWSCKFLRMLAQYTVDGRERWVKMNSSSIKCLQIITSDTCGGVHQKKLLTHVTVITECGKSHYFSTGFGMTWGWINGDKYIKSYSQFLKRTELKSVPEHNLKSWRLWSSCQQCHACPLTGGGHRGIEDIQDAANRKTSQCDRYSRWQMSDSAQPSAWPLCVLPSPLTDVVDRQSKQAYDQSQSTHDHHQDDKHRSHQQLTHTNGASDQPSQMGFLRQVAVFASKHTQVGGVVSKEAQVPVLFSTSVTKICVTLRAGHVITAFCLLNVDLAAWALLSVSLPVFDDAGPVTQQFISFPVVSTLQTFVPRCVAFKTPDKLALCALNLILVFGLGGCLLAVSL